MAQRFPLKLEILVTQEIVDAVELLAADQLLTASDVGRQALLSYLRQLGVLASPRSSWSNGAHHQAAE
jgi:hypothetical protein